MYQRIRSGGHLQISWSKWFLFHHERKVRKEYEKIWKWTNHCICKENKRQNTETKIGYQRNGRKKHSMANTQRELREADFDQNKTKKWLRSTGLKAERKGLIIEAQDQSLTKRSYHARIIKDGTNLICRICNRYEETIDHIVSSCPELEYIQRHNKVAACLHCKTCQHYNIQVLD